MKKTPDEIKKGLERCQLNKELLFVDCSHCPYYMDTAQCDLVLHADALAYIHQLESRLAQAERERDAAVRDCARFPCYTCTEKENGDFCPQCRTTGTFRALHEWRGVCPENTKEEK